MSTTRPLRSLLLNNERSAKSLYICKADVEPLCRYRSGGYHPVHIGDLLKDGRYRVLDKIGWGSYSTIWAARDQELSRNVALKVVVSEAHPLDRELRMLRLLSDSEIRGEQISTHIVRLLDNFRIDGPNGMHHCIVTELLGPSVPAFLDIQAINTGRLPASWARSVSLQVLTALAHLHSKGIGHGDVHTGNIVFKEAKWESMLENDLMSLLTPARTESVIHRDNCSLEPSVPRYLVWPQTLPINVAARQDPEIRLIDFGESFDETCNYEAPRTPLSLRAPELIFDDEWDHRVDLWSVGCTIFELFAGQPPFDTTMITKDILIEEMIEEIGSLPERWAWKQKRGLDNAESLTLEDWLLQLYFDDEHAAQMSREQVIALGKILRSLMRYESSQRADAAQVLQNPWFRDR